MTYLFNHYLQVLEDMSRLEKSLPERENWLKPRARVSWGPRAKLEYYKDPGLRLSRYTDSSVKVYWAPRMESLEDFPSEFSISLDKPKQYMRRNVRLFLGFWLVCFLMLLAVYYGMYFTIITWLLILFRFIYFKEYNFLFILTQM